MKDTKNIIPENISGEELKNILKFLKLYRDLRKKLWNRWKDVFKNLVEKKDFYKLEYFTKASREDSINEALEVFEKVFWDKVWKDELILSTKNNLSWWIRVFKNDNMVDLSFNKIKEILK